MRVEQDGRVVVIVNEDPPINRMSLEYIDEIEELLTTVATDDSVRALVFTADGEDNFSVGMDLKQLQAEGQARGGFEAVLDQRRRVLRQIETLGKPSIATLFGYCLGGGLELPLACTFRLAATEGSKIGLPEVDLGAVPAWGGRSPARQRSSVLLPQPFEPEISSSSPASAPPLTPSSTRRRPKLRRMSVKVRETPGGVAGGMRRIIGFAPVP